MKNFLKKGPQTFYYFLPRRGAGRVGFVTTGCFSRNASKVGMESGAGLRRPISHFSHEETEVSKPARLRTATACVRLNPFFSRHALSCRQIMGSRLRAVTWPRGISQSVAPEKPQNDPSGLNPRPFDDGAVTARKPRGLLTTASDELS